MPNGNPWYVAAEQSLPQYVPLPLDQLMQASNIIQARGESNMADYDQTAQGIASISARLPGHQKFLSQYQQDFNTEAQQLLDQYNNDVSDPQFSRDWSRLKNKYVNNPNLRTIMSANQLLDLKSEDMRKLSVEGKKFIDTNPNPTGLDEQGNLIADVGGVRATKFDENIRTKFRDTLQAKINDGRGLITNQQAIQGTIRSFVNLDQDGNIVGLNTNDSDIRDALMYYTSIGYDPQEASAQILNDLQREAQSATMLDRDYQYDRLLLDQRRLTIAEEAHRMKKIEFNNSLSNLPTISVDYSSVKDLPDIKNKKLREVKNISKNIDPKTGMLKSIEQGSFGNNKFAWTPENEAMLEAAGGWEPIPKIGGPTTGSIGGYTDFIRAKSTNAANSVLNQAQRDQIEYMREELGLSPNETDKSVVDKYTNMVSVNAYLPTAIRFNTEAIGKALYNVWGRDLSGAIIQEGNKFDPINTKKFKVDDFKNGHFVEIVTARIPGLDDSPAVMRFSAEKDGKQVNYYKPLPENLESQMPLSLAKSTAISSGLSNRELLDPSNGAVKPIIDERTGQVRFYVAPQNLGNKIEFAIITADPDTGEAVAVRNPDGSLRYMDNNEIRLEELRERSKLDVYSKSYRSTTKEQ